jgi:hypothetical protein
VLVFQDLVDKIFGFKILRRLETSNPAEVQRFEDFAQIDKKISHHHFGLMGIK